MTSSNVAQETQEFEVGVCDGNDVTPVTAGYFAHLGKVRGESKKMKGLESAREAVANGSAGTEEIRMASNGAEVNDEGNVIPSGTYHDDGHASPAANSKKKRSPDEDELLPKNRQDMAIHNQHDFEDGE